MLGHPRKSLATFGHISVGTERVTNQDTPSMEEHNQMQELEISENN